VQTLVEVSSSMSKVIVDTQSKILSDYLERTASKESTPVPEAPVTSQQQPSLPLTSQIQKLLNSYRYEEAFSTVCLSFHVTPLIDKFEGTECTAHPYTDMALQSSGSTHGAEWRTGGTESICLALSHTAAGYVLHALTAFNATIGYDLSKDTQLKLTWLREAALVLNMQDPEISQRAPPLLTKLLRNLEELYPKFVDTPLASNCKLVMHIVNSLLK
jgi:hypothetical protein